MALERYASPEERRTAKTIGESDTTPFFPHPVVVETNKVSKSIPRAHPIALPANLGKIQAAKFIGFGRAAEAPLPQGEYGFQDGSYLPIQLRRSPAENRIEKGQTAAKTPAPFSSHELPALTRKNFTARIFRVFGNPKGTGKEDDYEETAMPRSTANAVLAQGPYVRPETPVHISRSSSKNTTDAALANVESRCPGLEKTTDRICRRFTEILDQDGGKTDPEKLLDALVGDLGKHGIRLDPCVARAVLRRESSSYLRRAA